MGEREPQAKVVAVSPAASVSDYALVSLKDMRERETDGLRAFPHPVPQSQSGPL